MFAKSGDQFNFFLPPYVVFGRGVRSTIPQYAQRLGMRRVLLVVDPFFIETDYFAQIQNGLQKSGIATTSWSGVEPDPTDVSVDAAANTYKKADCNSVICIGGGSGMDTGKSVAIMIASGAESIREHTPPTNRSVNGMVPTICVPTTSGTGAEVNPYAIVTNTLTGRKGLAYPGWELLSAQQVAIVDPELAASMPPKLTAITGVDALCQAMECYLTYTPNPISDDLAFRSIYLTAHNLREAIYSGQDMTARTNMSLAATLATMAFPNAGLSYPHHLNEVLADTFHLPHGVAVGSVLVATLEMLLAYKTERLALLATKAFDVPANGRSQRELAEAGIREVQRLLADINFPTLSQAIGQAKVDIDALLADWTAREPQFATPIGQERARRILKRSLEL